jgi:putative ABC transport system permease protein
VSRRAFTARVAVRTLLRSRGQAALVLATIAVPILIGTAATTVARSLELTPVRQLEAQVGPQAAAWVDAYQYPGLVQSPLGMVAPATDQGPAAVPTLAAYEDALTGALGPGHALHRLLLMPARWTAADGRYRDGGYLFEADLSVPEIAAAFPLAAGHDPQALGEVVVDHALADELGLAPGDHLTAAAPPGYGDGEALLPPTTVEVVGVARAIPGAAGRLAAVGLPGTALATPATVWGGTPMRWLVTGDPVTWDTVRAVNAVGSAVWSRAVFTDPPPASQVTLPDEEIGFFGASSEDRALFAILGVGLVGLVALLVAPSFAVGARRIRHEMGLLSAIGSGRRELRRVVLFQGVVAGVAGVVVGIGGGIGVAAAIRAVAHLAGSVALPDLRVEWSVVAVLAAIGLVAPALAAWWPARQAAREDPVAALTGRRVARSARRPRHGVAGAVVLAVGLLVCGAGVVRSSSSVLAGGALVLLVGVVLSLGPVVGLVARLAPRLATAGRYALRDADRNRSRTVPAAAGVLAAVALAVGAGGFSTAYDAHQDATWAPPSGLGTVRVSLADVVATGDGTAPLSDEQWAQLGSALGDHLALAGPTVPVRIGLPADPADPYGGINPQVVGGGSYPTDDRYHVAGWQPSAVSSAPLVDDGSTVSRLGLPGADAAAAALAAGRVVVNWSGFVAADGTVRFVVADGASSHDLVVPATVADLRGSQFRVIVPPALAADFGLMVVQVGLLAPVESTPSTDAEHEAATALDAVVPGAATAVERGPGSVGNTYVLVLALAAALIAVAAAGTCVALAAADARPDLATLAAVGSPTRVRRGIAAAQGAVIVALGVGLGAVVGMAFAAALVVARRFGGTGSVDATWSVHVPWPVLGLLVVLVPAVALGGAWLLTPNRLPLTRRIAG